MNDALQSLRQRRNFRDAGNPPIYSDSGELLVDSAKIYRMGKLFGLTPQEKEYLQDLGITDIFDLRSEEERSAEPDVQISSAVVHHLDFSGGLLGLEHVIKLYRKAAADPENVDGESYIRESYMNLPVLCADKVRSAVEVITRRDTPRILIHCAGGKDRTGFLTAVLLGAAGVPDELIIQDYMRSRRAEQVDEQILERYLERFAGYGIAVPARVARPFLTVDRRALQGVLDRINDRYGGMIGYLHHAAGLDSKRIQDLKRWLSH